MKRIERDVSRLTLGEMKRLMAILQTEITLQKEELAQKTPAHEVVEVKERGGVTFKLELVRCGRKNCRCAAGKGHGPYWYKYWREGGKTRSAYVGKKLPEDTSGQHPPPGPRHGARLPGR
ncbi:MAG TPA: DUF6788 family protein [Pyrinomonadaceae bacterium]